MRFLGALVCLSLCGRGMCQGAAAGPELELAGLHPRIPPAVGALLGDGSQCERDSRLLLQHYSNSTAWAVAMVDASAPGPQGALRGSSYQFGDFDECLSLHERGSPVEPQFCVVTLTAERDASIAAASIDDTWTSIDEVSPYADVRQIIQGVGQHFVAPRLHEFGSGVCVPRSCSPDQLTRAVTSLLERRPGGLLRLRVSVQPGLCTSHQEAEAAARGRAPTLWACAALLLLVCIGTTLDSGGPASSSKMGVREVLSAWSLRRNLARLTEPMKPFFGVDMSPMAGIRVLMACGVITFHHHGARESLPSSASRYFRTGSSAALVPLISTSLYIIDSFFFLSGLFFIPTFKSSPLQSVVHRVSRFLPVFVIVTAFNFFVYPYLGTGPFWKAHSEAVVEVCRRHWWKNFLFVSSNNEKCGVHLWSAAADVQLYVSVTIVAATIWKFFPRHSGSGLREGILAIAASVVVRFIVAYRERWTAAVYVTARLHRTVADENFWSMYGSASSHLIPYVCGIVTGKAILKLCHEGFTLSKAQTRVCSYLALALIPILAHWNFREWYYSDGSPRTDNPLRSSLVSVTSQLLQALLWLLLAVLGSPIAHSNSLRKALSAPIFLPLSRLTVSTYAAHWFPILLKSFSVRAPADPSLLSDVYDGLGHVIMGFSLGLALFLTLEAPLVTLYVMYSRRSSKAKHDSEYTNGNTANKLRCD